MGVLNVCCYPTSIALKAADHAYVPCGDGAYAWGCWGGNSGGTVVRSGTGSTARAEAIAGDKGRAGITHYLINGVCHQSANRILLPARITANNARGHLLSVSIFGLFGRPSAGLGLFLAPLYLHGSTSGDLDACIYQGTAASSNAPPEQAFIEASIALYDKTYPELLVKSSDGAGGSHQAPDQQVGENQVQRTAEFNIENFKLFVKYRAVARGQMFSTIQFHKMMVAREEFERSREVIEIEFGEIGSGGWQDFVRKFDDLTLHFQDRLAQILPPQDYEALLDISQERRMVLSDPEIVESVYAPGSKPRGPGRR
ncbi:hypothetical protein VA603_07435 [Stenotrophomonas sp. MH1]|uniref:Uncharacterized protein n=1 Tax=Stenotrophomonas capsici TaxID=3110230 RepID=A0ABU5V1Z2_9GAMM|nr:hypothetical protein [Stenotrophomonas sp. MH1]MEA5667357.1 hypothetical protein [Stenotrophomonas sp. MH1]